MYFPTSSPAMVETFMRQVFNSNLDIIESAELIDATRSYLTAIDDIRACKRKIMLV